jgi:hypothetical protein
MWSNTLLKLKIVKNRENTRCKLNDTGIPKFPQKITKLSTNKIRQNLSLPKSRIRLKRISSKDGEKKAIKIDFKLAQRQLSNLKNKISAINENKVKEEEVKPPRIPRHNMVLNRDKIMFKVCLVY